MEIAQSICLLVEMAQSIFLLVLRSCESEDVDFELPFYCLKC